MLTMYQQISARKCKRRETLSILVIRHLEKLGIDITRTFAFHIEVELVVAAICTCNCNMPKLHVISLLIQSISGDEISKQMVVVSIRCK